MNNTNELKCFALGLGVGVTAGLLLAPKSGSEVRQYLQSKAAEGTDYLKNQANGVINAAAGVIDRSGKTLRQQKENVAAAVEAGQVAYREAVATTPENWS